jgi:hypothetical protein
VTTLRSRGDTGFARSAIAEFPLSAFEVLRQPLEDGTIATPIAVVTIPRWSAIAAASRVLYSIASIRFGPVAGSPLGMIEAVTSPPTSR